jgi:hypothetical protein
MEGTASAVTYEIRMGEDFRDCLKAPFLEGTAAVPFKKPVLTQELKSVRENQDFQTQSRRDG